MVDPGKIAVGVILSIISVIIIMQLFGNSAAELVNAGNNVTDSGLPLSSLFSSNGIVMLVIVAGVLISVIVLALKGAKGGK